MASGHTTATNEESPLAIRVEGLSKTYGSGDRAVTAVDDVSFTVDPGEVVGLLGPNGAGKTTTIKSILGLVIPDAGTVEIRGVDVGAHPERAHAHVGAILEGARNVYWRLTVRENLSFFAGLGGEAPSAVRERHDRLLDLVGLADEADTTVNELSHGMKQKASLVSTLARDIDVVFMDEPTLGLDVEASIDLRGELRRLADRENVTIVLTSHDMDVIEAVCDRVIVLDDGSIIADRVLEDLLEVFQVKRYRVTVASPLGEDLIRELRGSFDLEITPADTGCQIEATVTDPDRVYELLSTLKAEGHSFRDLQSIDPDLEDVFLHVIGGGVGTGPGTDAGGTDNESDGGPVEVSERDE